MAPAKSVRASTRGLAVSLLWLACGHATFVHASRDTGVFLARADSARLAGLFDVELAALQFARASDSTDANALWRLARAYVELGELATEKSQKRRFFEEAMRDGKSAIVADSQSYIAYTWLAIAEGTSAGVADFGQRVKLAWLVRDHALKAIELNPKSDIAYHIMARWHAEIASIGGFKRAMADLLYGDLPEASYEESVAYYLKAIALNDQIHHELELAKVYLKMDENALALQKLEGLLAMESEMRLDEKYKAEARVLLAHLQ